MGVKKLQKVLFTFMLIVLLSGCAMKQEINMKINKNKSMEMSYISAFDDELIDMMIESDKEDDSDSTMDGSFNGGFGTSKEYTDEERWAFLEKNLKDGEDGIFKESENSKLTVEKYEKNGFKGYVFSGKLDNIDKITTTDESELKNSDLNNFGKDNMFAKNKGVYKAIIPFDTDGEYSSSSIPDGMGMDMKLIVELPSKAINSNATTVSEDGKTLTWDLTKVNENITFEFKFPVNMLLIGILGLGIGVVFIIVVVSIVSNSKKNNNNINNDLNNNTNNGLNHDNNMLNINETNTVMQPEVATPSEVNLNQFDTTVTETLNNTIQSNVINEEIANQTSGGQIENIFDLNNDNIIKPSINNEDDRQS